MRAGMLSLGLFVLSSFHPSVLVGSISCHHRVAVISTKKGEVHLDCVNNTGKG